MPAPGGEDAEHFTLDGQRYPAVASIRTVSDSYDFIATSRIYRWQDGGFVPFQSVETFVSNSLTDEQRFSTDTVVSSLKIS
jgi:hypothetical protein